jgi:glycine cleavage system P protein (glycine dehydrogenase) subunit 1
MRYLPKSDADRRAMLQAIGVNSIDALFAPIPAEYRLNRDLKVPRQMAESEIVDWFRQRSRENGDEYTIFLGAGAYYHYRPVIIDSLISRGEFLTAYTPYQAEVSQGTLQSIFEFQSIVSEIFGLPVANASMYDGASAAAEAVLMAKRLTRREKVLVSGGVHPHYRETIDTYLQGIGEGKKAIRTVPLGADGSADVAALEALASPDLAAIVIGYPNFFGCVGDLRRAAEVAHRHGALLVTVTEEPFALSLLEPPGEIGADIAVGEGQALGIPLQFGGPYAGLFTCREGREFLQQIPGRLVGETVDKHGERGYVLTLSTREQHIRRERATSNICTNTGLCALAVTIRMCMLGKQGFLEAGRQCLAKAEYLKSHIAKLRGYSLVYPGTPTFNEFAVRVRGGNAARIVEALEPKGFLAGLDLGRMDPARADQLLVAVTESRSRADLDAFLAALDAV